MTDSQVYRVFLDTPSAPLLFTFKQSPALRPKIGDSITRPLTFENFRIMRDEFVTTAGLTRVTDIPTLTRVTDSGLVRVTDGTGSSVDEVTHNYFVTPANDPNRISSWTTNKFADDQVLRQLFR